MALAEDGWDAPVLWRIIETVEKRSARVLENRRARRDSRSLR